MGIYYEDDHVTLYHGDCLTEHREWLEADVLVTDPPYGMGYTSGWHQSKARNTTGVANDHSPEVRDAALAAWGDKPSISFGSWRVQKPAKVRQQLIWDKGDDPGAGDWSFPWGAYWEEIYVSGDGFHGKRTNGVIRMNTLPKSSRPDHPTPKPVPLMERLVERCPPGVIADPFAGSGATLLAAKNLGRKAIGVELEEKYCEIIARRCAQELLELEWIA